MTEDNITLEQLESEIGIDPEATEQKFPYDPEVFNEESLNHLSRGYDIYIERHYDSRHVIEDPDVEDWNAINSTQDSRYKDLFKARYLCEKQAHCMRALKLYEYYVFGSDFTIELAPFDEESQDSEGASTEISKQSRRIWERTLEDNYGGWSVEEFGRRCWRDGEQFTRLIDSGNGLKLRFIDPENIRAPADSIEDTEGIVTAPDDVATPLKYQYVDEEGRLLDEIEADEIQHVKIDCDSNEKRGKTRFLSVIKVARLFEAFLENEVTHRQAQSSIVLVRKVAGRKGPSRAYDNSRTSTSNYDDKPISREKWRPGTIWTVGSDVDVTFAQPQNNFSDASPLAKLMLQYVSVATGFSYPMLTQDASGGGYGSDLVSESPVLQMIRAEQTTMGRGLKEVFKRVIEHAVNQGKLPGLDTSTLWDDWVVSMKFYDPQSHDRLKDAQAANLKVITKVWSRAEAQRRDGVDPVKMRKEISEEQEADLTDMAGSINAGPNPDEDNMKQSSQQNSRAGGTNQGDGEPIQHDDKL